MTDVSAPQGLSTVARRCASVALIVALLAAIGVAGAWAVSGGRWFVVRTPSMGTAAPVGTLLWVKPTSLSSVHVGDVITFVPPGLHTPYSHRVYAVDPDGTLMTKGDANGSPDDWKIGAGNLVGKVQARWWGIGWLVRAAPVLVIGALLLWGLVHFAAAPRWRLPLSVVGSALLLSIALYIFNPLVGADQISLLPTDPGVRATYVSTGLLPLRLAAHGGGHVQLRNGELGTVHTEMSAADGKFAVGLSPHFPWWWWLVLVGICFVPAVWTTAFGDRPTAAPRHGVA